MSKKLRRQSFGHLEPGRSGRRRPRTFILRRANRSLYLVVIGILVIIVVFEVVMAWRS
ncbi:hypothetical protein [Enterovirga sp. CN4-39]|uniref:hypothetical protein n=1 Tax=Enterovirga sp. CN4-39 TaxID=3400910 RepID=UPI003BFC9042